MSTWVSQGVLKGADGATGPTGGVFGSVLVDFGSSDNGGADAMSQTVTVSAAWVSATSYPIVGMASGGDHLDPDDETSEEVYALVTNIVNGVSFDVEVFAPNGTWGQWLVNWGAALTGEVPTPHAATHSNGVDNVTLAESQITNLVTDLAAKTPTSRTITAGDGLSGGGDLSANRSLAVDATVGRTGGTSHYYDYEEFIGAPRFLSLGNSGGAAAISSISQIANSAFAHHGLLQLCPGSAASQWARAYMNPFYPYTGTTLILRAIVFPSGLTTTSQCFFGITDQPGPIVDVSHNYVGWFFSPTTSVNWCSYMRAVGSVTGPNSSGVAAASAYTDLKLVITPASVGYYINGALVDTITSPFPASGTVMYPSVYISSATQTNSPSLYADTFEIDLDGGNTGKFLKASI